MDSVGSPESLHAPLLSDHEPLRLCIVDDRDDVAELIRLVLRQSRCEVSVAGTLSAGRMRIAAVQPHIVLLDLLLPGGMNGLSLCAEIKRASSVLPLVLIFSAHVTLADHERVRSLGADGLLLKPISPQRLCTLVEQIALWLRRQGPKPEHLWDGPGEGGDPKA